MKITALRSLTRLDAFLQLMLLLALTPLLPIPKSVALAPQDSTHLASIFEKLPDERWWYAKVFNNRVWYGHTVSPGIHSFRAIRARDFTGALVFEHSDPTAAPDKGYAVSADGRLYYHFRQTQYELRIAIVAPDGTRLGDFGPAGKAAGYFGAGHMGNVEIAISPVTGRVYVSDENSGSSADPAKKGQVRVFDRDGNFLHEFRTTGVLASTLEGYCTHLLVRGDAKGQDELFVVDDSGNWKVFGGDGQFRKLVTGFVFGGEPRNQFNGSYFSTYLSTAFIWKDKMVISDTSYARVYVFPATASSGSEVLANMALVNESYRQNYLDRDQVIGIDDKGGLITVGVGFEKLRQYSYPNFSNFDAVTRNAVPNPWVLGVSQRPGGGIVDIDYQVDDANDSVVTTALVAFAGGEASLSNVLPMNTLIEGTGTRVGANQPTGAVQRLTWNAGSDWNVDFGTLRVMALARDSRSHWFDVHLVEIPADGDRPAVAISRNPLLESDFLTQFLWLVAKKDPSVKLIDGVLFGTTGADNGVILANGTSSTPAGREFLLKRDGLRVATSVEVVRAREGATPGFEVRLDPPLRMSRPTGVFPDQINEFGVESGSVPASGGVYVVRATAG